MDSYDETWYAYPLWIAAAVEVDLAVITACAPALRPFLIIYLRPLITTITSSRNHSRTTNSKKRGYMSAPSVQTSILDSDLEKKSGTVISQQQVRVPKRSLSRTEQNKPERLTILRRQSFEVYHEDVENKKWSSEELGIGLAITKSGVKVENESPTWDNNGKNQPGPSLSVPSAIPNVSPQSPFPLTESANNSNGLPPPKSARTRRSNVGSPDPPDLAPETVKSFWPDDGYRNSTTPEPLIGSEHADSRTALRNGERRWDIQRNPFQESAEFEDEEKRGDRSGGRWNNEVYKGIELKGISRSQSLNQSLDKHKSRRT
jgi:hypothetical protein